VQTPFLVFRHWKHPRVRKEIAKTYLAAFTEGMTILTLAKYGLGAEVGLDPTSPDWGKIKFGNTRFDVWAGVQQPMRVIARIVKMGGGHWGVWEDVEKEGPLELIGRFSAYKASPIVTLGQWAFTGKDMVGDEVGPTEMAVRTIMPFVVDDIREAWMDAGFGRAAMVAPAVFLGWGASTYEDKGRAKKLDIPGVKLPTAPRIPKP
jgi:hypothetical protein